MERKIGEIFEYNGEWYQCLNGECTNCDLFIRSGCSSPLNTACSKNSRKDNTPIIFKKLEKVGEPYDFQKRTFQTYKLHTIPFLSEDVELVAIPSKDNNTIEIEIKQTKEDMEEDREYSEEEFKNNPRFQHHKNIEQVNNMRKMKPFNLEQAKAGKPVCTRDGRKARIICFDKKCLDGQVLIALVDCSKEECMYFYTTDGKCIDDFSSFDLMMLTEKRSGWVNIDKGGSGKITISSPYSTKEEAIHNDNECTIDTIKIEWEE